MWVFKIFFLFLFTCLTLFFPNNSHQCDNQTQYLEKNTCCNLCQPGYRLGKRCEEGSPNTKCIKCNPGFYMDTYNKEKSCHACYDCSMKYLIYNSHCTMTRNSVCGCVSGYRCTNTACLNCERINSETPDTPPTGPEKLTPTEAADPTATCEPGAFYSESFRKCESHKNCTSLGLSMVTAGNSTHDTVCGNPTTSPGRDIDTKWWHILVGFFAVFLCIAIVLRLFWKLEDGACLKQIIKISAPDGHMDASKGFGALCGQTPNYCGRPGNDHQPDCRLDTPLGPDSVSQGPGNLGPFHIYSAGTVFVSLLNHVTGFEKEAEEDRKGEKKAGDWLGPAPMPSSPPVHLSEEERDGQSHSISLPSQEQGKETHLSKEERM